ncbi:multiple antibiotic resistance (MarC)-related protein [Desulfurococcaceae archaeon AG1]|jgi:multiple antibiotic resistance protein|nr:MAG: MarC family protein [Desulfurococcaceae archaeon]GAY25978.1 multiple antibiotic resistance (MarC)-related protein [Desulfurococcaceae archaeon AG1]
MSMPADLSTIVSIAVSVFAIMDPVAAIPTMITYIEEMRGRGSNDIEGFVKKVINRTIIAVFIMITVFSLAGEYILRIFGVSLLALRIAGGVILMAIAIEMLMSSDKPERVSSGDFAIVPIATPLIVGPGTMSTLILYSRIYGSILTLLGAYVALLATYPLLRYSYRIMRYMGTTALRGIGKFMAIIIAAIAVELFVAGLRDLGLVRE